MTEPPTSALEAALKRDRLLVALGLAGTVALAWAYLVPSGLDMYGAMTGPSVWMMAATWDARYFVLIFLMWSVMMIGMMLPSAAPTILLFARAARQDAQSSIGRAYAFAAGYLVAWVGFSLAATTLQRTLAAAALVSPMMELTSAGVGAFTLIGAGLYQWAPLKRLCLTRCRSPFQWLSQQWRPGTAGALRMGMSHGMYCLGCCWVLMLLLFVGGVMNLLWIALITAFVFIEKLAPHGAAAGRVAGAVLIALGLRLLI